MNTQDEETLARTRRDWAEMTLARGGGIMTYGGGLGVFVSKAENQSRTPKGWVFVDVEDTTLERLVETLEVASRGRKAWPKNAKEDKGAAEE